jgi:hypothetical protein
MAAELRENEQHFEPLLEIRSCSGGTASRIYSTGGAPTTPLNWMG